MTGGLEPGMHRWKTTALTNTPQIRGPSKTPRIMNKYIKARDTVIAIKLQTTSTIN